MSQKIQWRMIGPIQTSGLCTHVHELSHVHLHTRMYLSIFKVSWSRLCCFLKYPFPSAICRRIKEQILKSNSLNVWKYAPLSSLLQRFQLFSSLPPLLHTCFKNHTWWPRTQAPHLQLSTQIQIHPKKPSCWVLRQHKLPQTCSTSIYLLRVILVSCSPKMVSVSGM